MHNLESGSLPQEDSAPSLQMVVPGLTPATAPTGPKPAPVVPARRETLKMSKKKPKRYLD